jgi:hypothetical protein
MADIDRNRLAAILGMLGSSSAGERDNAARLADQFIKQHGITWQQALEERVVYHERIVPQPIVVHANVGVWEPLMDRLLIIGCFTGIPVGVIALFSWLHD